MSYKVLYYLNQFFGQVGGEEKANIAPFFNEAKLGPALGFNQQLEDQAEIVGTIVCGDNFFNENKEEAIQFIIDIVREMKPDLVVAGPAFNAGRYGMACAGVAKTVVDGFGIPAVTGMYHENPGVEECRAKAIVVETTDSAAGMKKALAKMAAVSLKLLKGESLGLPGEEGYIAQGKRLTVFSDKKGSVRALDMLIARLKGEDIITELPMPVFDRVDPADAVKDLSSATIALITSGGIVPKGNPDRIQSASAQKWGKYNIASKDSLEGEFYSIHGGYDPVYANEKPDRVAPLDLLRKFEQEGVIGKVYDYFYITTGTGTSVGNSIKFGMEIGKELMEAGVDAAILTST
jgi:glycine reductase complex component B subunit gamma